MLRLVPHPGLHPLFETLGYVAGFAVYRALRQAGGDVIAARQRGAVVVGAVLGALVGSRLLGLLEQAPRVGIDWSRVLVPGGGKTIVGGLLGGWLGVELVKRLRGIRTRTGDLFAVPLCVGIAVGRMGCLLAGLADDTYGKPTGVTWAVDFGDGISRHPTQAYEIVFLLGLAGVLVWMGRWPHADGVLFRVFLAGYLVWRLGVDFLKPQPLVSGMNVIQWACVAGLMLLALDEVRTIRDARRAGGLGYA